MNKSGYCGLAVTMPDSDDAAPRTLESTLFIFKSLSATRVGPITPAATPAGLPGPVSAELSRAQPGVWRGEGRGGWEEGGGSVARQPVGHDAAAARAAGRCGVLMSRLSMGDHSRSAGLCGGVSAASARVGRWVLDWIRGRLLIRLMPRRGPPVGESGPEREALEEDRRIEPPSPPSSARHRCAPHAARPHP